MGGKHCRKFKDFRKFQSRFKDFQGPFYDVQGPQANVTIFKAIAGLKFIFQNSMFFKALRKPCVSYTNGLNGLMVMKIPVLCFLVGCLKV